MKKHKKISLLLFALFIFCSYTSVFSATQKGYVDATNGLNVRKDAGTTYSKVGTLSFKTEVNIISTKSTADSSTGCPTKVWYYITSGNISGYVCSQYIIITDTGEVSSSEMASMTDKEFEEYLTLKDMRKVSNNADMPQYIKFIYENDPLYDVITKWDEAFSLDGNLCENPTKTKQLILQNAMMKGRK